MESFPPPDPSTQVIKNPSLHVQSLDMDFHFQPESVDNNDQPEADQLTEGPHLVESSHVGVPTAEVQREEVQIDSYDALAINTTLVLAGMKKTFTLLRSAGRKAKSGAVAGAKMARSGAVAGAKMARSGAVAGAQIAKRAAVKTKTVVARESSIAYNSGRTQVKEIRANRAISASLDAEIARDKKADELHQLTKKEKLNSQKTELYAFIGRLATAGTEADRVIVRQDQINRIGSIPTAKSSTERRRVRAIMKKERSAAVKQAYNDRVNKAYYSPTAQTRGVANRLANMSQRRDINQLANNGSIDEAERLRRISDQKANPASSKNPIQKSTERSAQRARTSTDNYVADINVPTINPYKRSEIICQLTENHKKITSKIADSVRLSQEAQIHRQRAADKKALR
jgi:hypothetical protein